MLLIKKKCTRVCKKSFKFTFCYNVCKQECDMYLVTKAPECNDCFEIYLQSIFGNRMSYKDEDNLPSKLGENF